MKISSSEEYYDDVEISHFENLEKIVVENYSMEYNKYMNSFKIAYNNRLNSIKIKGYSLQNAKSVIIESI